MAADDPAFCPVPEDGRRTLYSGRLLYSGHLLAMDDRPRCAPRPQACSATADDRDLSASRPTGDHRAAVHWAFQSMGDHPAASHSRGDHHAAAPHRAASRSTDDHCAVVRHRAASKSRGDRPAAVCHRAASQSMGDRPAAVRHRAASQSMGGRPVVVRHRAASRSTGDHPAVIRHRAVCRRAFRPKASFRLARADCRIDAGRPGYCGPRAARVSPGDAFPCRSARADLCARRPAASPFLGAPGLRLRAALQVGRSPIFAAGSLRAPAAVIPTTGRARTTSARRSCLCASTG
jgi:hypothetical protein